MKIQIGVIGYKNHALRLIKLIHSINDCAIHAVYHPDKRVDHPRATKNLSDLYQCDAVIIASPNDTHCTYILQLLENFKGCIFCEKPPALRLADLKKLSRLAQSDKKRVYFNYNFRFGLLNSVLTNPQYLKKLGAIHHIRIISTHGLAFKKEYANSWRADGKKNLHAITQTVAIHYVDLLRLHFGEINAHSYAPSIVAKTGTAYDTAYLSLHFKKVTASVFVSYACPSLQEIMILGTEGIARVSQGALRLFYPRNTLDAKGRLCAAPLKLKIAVNEQKEYEQSLKKSLEFFMGHVRKKSAIDIKHFKASIASNQFLLRIEKKGSTLKR